MYSTYGMRPDGKPYSYLPIPFPLPECPTNKLIVFDEFSKPELSRLGDLIGTRQYESMVKAETTYYRAYWLATKLGRPKSQSLGFLLSAIWQVTPDDMSAESTAKTEDQLKRYQSLFISEARALDSAVSAKDRLWIEARAANAARQLKQFSESEQLRKRAVLSLSGDPEERGSIEYLAKLKDVIARKDAGIEPLDMIPPRQIAFTCARQRPSNAFDRAACAKPEVAAQVAELRKSRQKR